MYDIYEKQSFLFFKIDQANAFDTLLIGLENNLKVQLMWTITDHLLIVLLLFLCELYYQRCPVFQTTYITGYVYLYKNIGIDLL